MATQSDIATTIKVLREVADDPKGFYPDELFHILHLVVSFPYLEVAIVRKNEQGQVEILLAYRDDLDWKGWHIPGGLFRTQLGIEEVANKIARREINSKVKLLAIGKWHKWMTHHPHGKPFSHTGIFTLDEPFTETENLRWFSQPPENMIDDGGRHAKFIEAIFKQVKEENLLP